MINKHSLSNNKSFKSHLNAKNFNIFFKTCRTCVKRSDALSVSAATYKVDVNSSLEKNLKEPLSSTIQTEDEDHNITK